MRCGRNRVMVEMSLPCGCTLRTGYEIDVGDSSDDANRQPDSYRRQLQGATDALSTWAETRAAKHLCKLVSEDNPHGQPRNH